MFVDVYHTAPFFCVVKQISDFIKNAKILVNSLTTYFKFVHARNY